MSESDHAAERRADYVRALNEELDQCERAGKKDRVKAINAELSRLDVKPADRQAPPTATADRPPAAVDASADKREAASADLADVAASHRAQAEQGDEPPVAKKTTVKKTSRKR